MATESSTSGSSIVSLPSHPVGYVTILAALVTGVVHLLLGPQVMGFSQTMGILFILNGLGFLGGVALYLSQYWNRPLYLVAAGYALVTIVALFGFQGFSVEAFYMRGELNPMAVAAKVAELVVAAGALFLYSDAGA
ncbi:DUF7475 family protein [Halobellus inordinatus]|uniref:DUF7475 family protein n=1 Tax=Halobellus inordinatus TaxID=1126236 RepID=UPI00210A2A77|nr:hypothetical protein [Halobellus inordinatus]